MDPAADLRAAVAAALALTPDSRLIAIDGGPGGGGPIDAALGDLARLTVYAAVGGVGRRGPRAVVADPLRLPFVSALADRVVATIAVAGDPQARLREIWRVLAPAGTLVVVVPVPSSDSVASLVRRAITRRRVGRILAAAMFEVTSQVTVAGALVVRADKRDGVALPRRVAAASRVRVTA